jgi:hypothetical protein
MADPMKLAAVFEAMADYIDENETQKTSAIETARKSRLDKIASAHLAANGEEMSDVERQKLARVDDAALVYIENQFAKQANTLDSLGAGTSPDTDVQPRTIKEAGEAADDRFLSWITGS